jgi:type I restriction enzyme R subunit
VYLIHLEIAVNWRQGPHLITEQFPIDDGRIITIGGQPRRKRKKRADYLLCYTRDYPIAIVEAKRKFKHPQDGLQQAKDYAELLGLRFAYSTKGREIVEYDYITGLITQLDSFPP